MNRMVMAAAVVCSIGLAACGGGGDDAPAASGSAEGIWGGTSSTGLATALIVAQDGQTWGVFGRDDDTPTAGLLRGTTRVEGNRTTIDFTGINLLDGTTATGAFEGTVRSKAALNLTVRGSQTTLEATYDSSYDAPVSLAGIAGNYTVSMFASGLVPEQGVPITIAPTGAISGSSATPGCTSSGTVSPRTPGKNILNFSLTFQGANCPFAAGSSFTGVAQAFQGDFVAIGFDGAATAGLLVTGSR